METTKHGKAATRISTSHDEQGIIGSMMETACLACANRLDYLGRRRDAGYGACPGCGSVQLLEIPDEESLQELYAESYHAEGHYKESAAEHQETRARVCEQVFDLVQEGRQDDDARLVVELGSGWGNLARLFTAKNIPYMGIDPNAVMVEETQEMGLRIVEGSGESLDNLDTGGVGVQTVVSMAVFEHLPNPERELRRMAECLAPRGRVVIQCPTSGVPRLVGPLFRLGKLDRELPGLFGSLEPPWHIFLPSPQGVRTMAERCGLRVVDIVPSLSGRAPNASRYLQIGNEFVARAGHAVLGESWPLSMAHVFVLERVD